MEGTKNGKGRHHQALISNVSLINLNGLKPLEPKNIVEDELEVIGIYLNSKSSSMSFILRRTLMEAWLSHPLVFKRSWMLTLQRAS